MASAPLTVLPYKLIGGRWSPMISAGLYMGQAWKPVELYLDSGATYTIVRAPVADEMRFDYAKGREVFVQVGDGAVIPVFLHDLPVQIGDWSFVAPVGFSSKLGVPCNLLGRLGLFDHFRICFHDRPFVGQTYRTAIERSLGLMGTKRISTRRCKAAAMRRSRDK